MTHPVNKSPIFEAKVSKQETQMTNLLEQKLQLLPLQPINRLIRHLKIKHKITLGYAVGLGVMISTNLIGLVIGDCIYNQANQSRLKIATERKLLADLQQSTLSLQLVPGFPLSPSKTSIYQDLDKIIIQQTYQAKAAFNQLNKTADTSSIKGLKPLLLSYDGAFNKFIDSLAANSKKNNLNKLTKVDLVYQNLENLAKNQAGVNTQKLISQITIFIDIAEKKQLKAESELDRAYMLRGLVLLLSLGFSLLCTYLIILYSRYAIASPMEALAGNVRQVNHQLNLDIPLDDISQDEITILNAALIQIVQRLSDLQKSQEQVKLDTDAANQTKNKFLANMTHELRTPLNGILGYAQILSRSLDLTEEQKHGIHTIYQCGFNLLNMINDILDISKIDENTIELNFQDFHFPSLIQGIVEIFRLQSEQKGIDFIYQKAENLPMGIVGDQQRLRQVLVNLLNNAIKFTDTGQIKLQVDTTYESGNVSIHFIISDTGIGISPEQHKTIFLPFEKLGNSHNQTSGIGLGLAITQKIVRMMGGEIQLQSQLGNGSIFQFAVEFSISEDWTESTTITSNGQLIGYFGNRRKILVIDDNWENRSFIVSLLKPLDFMTVEVSNGKDGLAECYEFQPDLIISDLEMPIMDGWEFVKKVRSIEKFKNIPIILSSATTYNYDLDYEKAIAAGANDLLAKPVEVAKLYLLLAKTMQLTWKYGKNDLDNYPENDTYPEECSEIFINTEIVIPPTSELTKLMKYVKKGQIKGIKQELEKIANKDPKYETFVKVLNKYVRVLNIQKIRKFLQEHVKDSSDMY
jgi:signal transduction histidine kinase/DNA-binding NarL/FixJ family response regulator